MRLHNAGSCLMIPQFMITDRSILIANCLKDYPKGPLVMCSLDNGPEFVTDDVTPLELEPFWSPAPSDHDVKRSSF